jgi:GNAT superfamily N-acetyltransferase
VDSGGFGWIGLIATDPDHSGKGVARAVTSYLVDYLNSIDCGAALDGSGGGAPLYEKMGFADHGLTTQFQFTGQLAGQLVLAPGFIASCPATELLALLPSVPLSVFPTQ